MKVGRLEGWKVGRIDSWKEKWINKVMVKWISWISWIDENGNKFKPFNNVRGLIPCK